jgi:hypothetical protein
VPEIVFFDKMIAVTIIVMLGAKIKQKKRRVVQGFNRLLCDGDKAICDTVHPPAKILEDRSTILLSVWPRPCQDGQFSAADHTNRTQWNALMSRINTLRNLKNLQLGL